MPTTRIYVVISGDERRLIEATSTAQAIRHCAEPRFSAHVASAKEVAELSKYGVTVETAGEYAATAKSTQQQQAHSATN